jgi:endonuclease/exonuclease/phosphatase (EEP) superfamily protein YafD
MDGTMESEGRMGERILTSPLVGFFKRLTVAGLNLLTPLQTGLLVTYYTLRELGGGDLWFIDALSYILPWLYLPFIILLPGILLLHRTRLMLILVAIPTTLFLSTYGGLYLPRSSVHSTGPSFTVMTYNVLWTNKQADRVAASIEEHDPDIVGLHEILPSMGVALEERLAEHYPYRKLENSYGILSRFPILQYEFYQLGDGTGSWVQQLVLDINGHQVNLLNAHPRSPPLEGFHPFGLPLGIPTGFLNQVRDADIRDLLSRIERLEDPLVVIGDFNLTDQQIMYVPLTSRLEDAHRESGWGMGFTFSRFPRIGLPMWRIDYVFYSPDLVALSVTTGDYGGSDHRPVIAELSFRKLP